MVTCEQIDCALCGKTGIGRSAFEAREHLSERAKGYGFSVHAANDAGALARRVGGDA